MNTWGDIRDTSRAILGDPGAYFFSATQMVNWANKGLRDLAQYTHYQDERIDKTVSGGAGTVALGDGVMRVWRVEGEDSGTMQVLASTTKDQLIADYKYWYNVTGTPRFYYLDLIRGGSGMSVGLYRIPSASTDFYFYCKTVPDEVSDSSSTTEIDVPDWCVGAVMYYILSQAYSAEGKLQNFQRSEFWLGLYNEMRERLKERTGAKIISKVDKNIGDRLGLDVWARAPEIITGTP